MSAYGQPPAAAPAPVDHAALAAAIHTHAVEAEKNVEQVCTLLGQAGADPTAVDTCTKIADVLRRIAAGVAQGGTPAHGAAQATPPVQHTMSTATDAMMAAHHAAAAGAAQ